MLTDAEESGGDFAPANPQPETTTFILYCIMNGPDLKYKQCANLTYNGLALEPLLIFSHSLIMPSFESFAEKPAVHQSGPKQAGVGGVSEIWFSRKRLIENYPQATSELLSIL